MKIIIVGCGKVGTSLAERLSVEDHDLVMVALAEQKVEEVSNGTTPWELWETEPVLMYSRRRVWIQPTFLLR